MKPGNCEIIQDEGLQKGFCVIMDGDEVVYNGPVRQSPELADGLEIYLSPEDWRRVVGFMDQIN